VGRRRQDGRCGRNSVLQQLASAGSRMAAADLWRRQATAGRASGRPRAAWCSRYSSRATPRARPALPRPSRLVPAPACSRAAGARCPGRVWAGSSPAGQACSRWAATRLRGSLRPVLWLAITPATAFRQEGQVRGAPSAHVCSLEQSQRLFFKKKSPNGRAYTALWEVGSRRARSSIR
jgi:hypothetical protein